MSDTAPSILEVRLTDDGHFTYRLRATSLNTKAYAQILMALAADIAEMFQVESQGKLNRDVVYQQIILYMQEQMKDDNILPETTLQVLQ